MLANHEGRKDFLYGDTNRPPIVTTAVGHALFSAEEALRLPLLDSRNQPASQAQILAEYNRARNIPINPWQRNLASLFLPSAEIDALLEADIAIAHRPLIQELTDFDSLPDPARLALYDIAFECGSLTYFPLLRKAVEARDWAAAAQQCRRGSCSAERNQDTIALFNSLISVSES